MHLDSEKNRKTKVKWNEESMYKKHIGMQTKWTPWSMANDILSFDIHIEFLTLAKKK